MTDYNMRCTGHPRVPNMAVPSDCYCVPLLWTIFPSPTPAPVITVLSTLCFYDFRFFRAHSSVTSCRTCLSVSGFFR